LSPSPVPEYVEICVGGARYWGKGFHDDFLRTTEVHPDVTEERLRWGVSCVPSQTVSVVLRPSEAYLHVCRTPR